MTREKLHLKSYAYSMCNHKKCTIAGYFVQLSVGFIPRQADALFPTDSEFFDQDNYLRGWNIAYINVCKLIGIVALYDND